MTGGILPLAARFEELGGALVRNNLTDDEFASLVASADVALVPYPVRPFRTRTSGVALDALRAGKPVVAVRGTWAGDLVERLGAGLTYAEGDVVEMERAITGVSERIDEYRRRVADIREAVEEEHAPERLIRFLLGRPESDRPTPPAREEVDVIGEMGARLRRLYRWHASALDAERVSAAISQDDQQRSADTLRDEVDLLRRGIRYRERAGRAEAG